MYKKISPLLFASFVHFLFSIFQGFESFDQFQNKIVVTTHKWEY